MLPTPSFITANFVARPLNYRMAGGWRQGDQASNEWYAPLATFEARFDEMLAEVKALGFSAIDLWGAHLNWQWATLQHVEIAKQLLAKHGLAVRSYASWVMGGPENLHAACRLCAALDIPYFVGNCEMLATDRAAAVAILREHGVGCAFENHPEKSAAEVLARIGAGDEEFVDMGHETCRAGDGIVGMRAVVEHLRAIGFRGSIGIEHEPETFDPREEVRESRERVEQWWDSTPMPESAAPLRVAIV